MNRLKVRLLVGLVVAVALAWGAGRGLRAATGGAPAKPSLTATTANGTATAAAKPDAKATPATPLLTARPVMELNTPAAPAAGAPQGGKSNGKPTRDQVFVDKFKRVAPSQQKAAAKRAAKLGLKPGIAGLGGIGALAVQAPDPGGVPHYFGPYGNWAFSPLPKGPVGTVTVVDGGTGYTAATVTVDDAYLPL